jgi:hypothetical protein
MPTKALKEENPAVQEIANLLAREFNKVEPKIKSDLKVAYRREARQGFDGLMEAAKDQKNVGLISGRSGMAFHGWYAYTAFDTKKAERSWREKWGKLTDAAYTDAPPPGGLLTWEQIRRWAEFLSVDYRDADQSAERAFENARDSFIHKNVDKVRNVLEARTELVKAIVQFGFHRNVFTGSIEVQLLPSASFEAEIGLKYVIRTTPRVTPYFQYPLNFTTATIGGIVHARPSEEELRLLLGGKVRGTPAQELAAQGFCPRSAQTIPYSEATAWITNRMSPYMKCPDCVQTVSVRNYKWRKHFPVQGKTS